MFNLNDLSIIIKHLDKYPLITQKQADYKLFKEVVELKLRGEHLTKEGLLKAVSLKASINKGLSDKLKKEFPNVIPAIRPVVLSRIKTKEWLIGFTEAEGCFQIITQKINNNKLSVSLRFSITQHSRDESLISSIAEHLNCGRLSSSRKETYYIVSTFSDIYNIIIPMFNEYPLLGAKQQDFIHFVKAAELIKSKGHLTE